MVNWLLWKIDNKEALILTRLQVKMTWLTTQFTHWSWAPLTLSRTSAREVSIFWTRSLVEWPWLGSTRGFISHLSSELPNSSPLSRWGFPLLREYILNESTLQKEIKNRLMQNLAELPILAGLMGRLWTKPLGNTWDQGKLEATLQACRLTSFQALVDGAGLGKGLSWSPKGCLGCCWFRPWYSGEENKQAARSLKPLSEQEGYEAAIKGPPRPKELSSALVYSIRLSSWQPPHFGLTVQCVAPVLKAVRLFYW